MKTFIKRFIVIGIVFFMVITPLIPIVSSVSCEATATIEETEVTTAVEEENTNTNKKLKLVVVDGVIEVKKIIKKAPFEDTNEYTYAELEKLIETQKKRKEFAHNVAENSRYLGWAESCAAIQRAKREWHDADEKQKYYEKRLAEDKWGKKMAEYPVATEVWIYLKEELGYSDAVCAGILGNMMTECGGHTLNLQWWLVDYSGWFYGICQWHKGYYPEVQGKDLQYQLDFLASTMSQEFGMFGSNALNRFLNMTNPADAAYDFARKYERCAETEWNYTSRRNNAWVAYNYFVNN